MKIKRLLTLAAIYIFEWMLFIASYFGGMFKQTAIADVGRFIGNSISGWPISSPITTFILLLWLALPTLVLVYLLNFKWPKVSIKSLLITHLIFLLSVAFFLEWLFRSL